MAKKRRKRKSRTELYRVRTAKLKPTYWFVVISRAATLHPGGNAFGLGAYTLRVAAGPRAA
jgi:hypothetical protein